MRSKYFIVGALAVCLVAGGAGVVAQDVLKPDKMTFFITSVGQGQGANLGGLGGADRHCATLAAAAGSTKTQWRAYLSAGGDTPVHARTRIGDGPWFNAKGEQVAANLDDLHGEAPQMTKASQLNEKGQVVNGRGDTPNQHDILTGSTADGHLSLNEDGTPQTCENWTASGAGSATVGHFDRQGGGPNPSSWNSSHPSRGCGQTDLEGSGGAGLTYCFAAD